MAGKSVSNINIGVVANTAGFSAGMKRAGSDVTGFVAKTRSVGSTLKSVSASFGGAAISVAKWGTALATASAVGAAYMYKRTTDLVSAQVDLAAAMNISVAALAGLDRAADLSGSSMDGMHTAIQKMNKGLGDAWKQGDKGKGKFAAIGLDLKKLLEMPTEQRFMTISDAIKGMSNEAQKASVAAMIFGKGGMEMINTLNLGSAELQRISNETRLFGTALSDVSASNIEASGDALADVWRVFEGMQMQLTAQLAPTVTRLAQQFTDWATSGGGIEVKMQGIADKLIPIMDSISSIVSTKMPTWIDQLSTALGMLDNMAAFFEIISGGLEKKRTDERGAQLTAQFNALDAEMDKKRAARESAAAGPVSAAAISPSVAPGTGPLMPAAAGPSIFEDLAGAGKFNMTAPENLAVQQQVNMAESAMAQVETLMPEPRPLIDLDTLDKGVSRVEDIADIQSDITDEIEAQNQESGTFKNAKLSTIGAGVGSVSSPGKGMVLPAMNGITTTPIDHFAAKATGGMTAAGQAPTTGQRGASGNDGGMLAVLQSILESTRETASNTRSQQVAVLG